MPKNATVQKSRIVNHAY